VGDWTDKWGTISSMRARGQDLHPRDREKIWEPWGGKFLNIVVGDRVVIIEGRDKGKIGVIKDVSRERGEVTVGGLNLVRALPQTHQLIQYLRRYSRSMSPSPNI